MVDPNDLVISGRDFSKLNLYEVCRRAKVLESAMYNQIKTELEAIVPYPAIFRINRS